MDPLGQKLREIEERLRELGVERPRLVETKEEFGDLAVPLHREGEPVSLARRLARELSVPGVRAEALGPYLNLRFEPRTLEEMLKVGIEGMGEDFGRLPRRGQRILLEHTSANPTGRLHVGRARNTLIGDSLRRILEFSGYDVYAEYYVNDLGRQVAILVWGLLNLESLGLGEPGNIDDYSEVYVRANASGPPEDEIRDIIRRYEEGEEELRDFVRRHVSRIVEELLAELEEYGIRFDGTFWESDLAWDGSARGALRRLEQRGIVKYEGKAAYVEIGGEKIYLTRSDGSTLYVLKDVAYHLNKAGRCDIMVNVLGEDHKLEAKVLSELLRSLGAPEPRVVIYSFVTLPEGRLSTRAGRVVYLKDLVQEAIERASSEVGKRGISGPEAARAIGLGAVKFNYLKVQPQKLISFRWEDALNFEGKTAPYVQYAHARACSILEKGGSIPPWVTGSLVAEEERALMFQLLKFPSVVGKAAELLAPNLVAEYLLKVADKFNTFYQKHRVLQSREPVRSARINLVNATRIVVKNGLYLLGIEAPEKM